MAVGRVVHDVDGLDGCRQVVSVLRQAGQASILSQPLRIRLLSAGSTVGLAR